MAGGDGAARVRVQRHRFDRADPSSPGSLWACRVVSGAFGRQGVDVRAGASGSDAHVGNGFRDGSRTPGVLPAAWHAGNQACPAAGASERLLPQVTPQPEISFISEDLPFRMGSRIWVPVQTAGHAPGHLSFFHADSGVLLCGDAVLPQISPNVSLLPGSDAEPLALFLAGLRRLRELHVRTAYPGHRHPFTHFRERIDTLLLHHEERLATIAGMLSAAGRLTAFEVCTALFGEARHPPAPLRHVRSAGPSRRADPPRRSRGDRNEDGMRYFSVRKQPHS